MQYLADQYSCESPYELGVRIQSVGLPISVRQWGSVFALRIYDWCLLSIFFSSCLAFRHCRRHMGMRTLAWRKPEWPFRRRSRSKWRTGCGRLKRVYWSRHRERRSTLPLAAWSSGRSMPAWLLLRPSLRYSLTLRAFSVKGWPRWIGLGLDNGLFFGSAFSLASYFNRGFSLSSGKMHIGWSCSIQYCSIEAHSLLSPLTLKYVILTSMSIAGTKLESHFRVLLGCFSSCFNCLSDFRFLLESYEDEKVHFSLLCYRALLDLLNNFCWRMNWGNVCVQYNSKRI